MSTISLQIKLNKRNPTYSTGEIISGRVIVTNSESEIVRKLFHQPFLIFYGGATTNLKGARIRHGIRVVSNSSLLAPSRHRFSDEEVMGQQTYLKSKVRLVPSGPGEEAAGREQWRSIQLWPGCTEFPFNFHLPENLPSSFTGPHGLISYDISLRLRIIGLSDICMSRIDFAVKQTVLLSCHPSIPTNREEYFSFDKLIWYGSARNGYGRNLSAIVHLPSKGYVPGEYVQLGIRVINKTPWKVEKTRVDFVQEIIYGCPVGSFTDCHELVNVTNFGNVCESPIPCTLRLPRKLIPTSTDGDGASPIISIQYYLVITLKLDCQTSLVKVGKIHVIIGTLPFGTFAQPAEPPALSHRHSAASIPSTSGSSRPRSASLRARPTTLHDYDEFSTYLTPPNFFAIPPPAPSYISLKGQDDDGNESPPPTYAEALQMEFESSN